jgi:peptidoglycan/LPS O-acetylase OafA/YrhL
MMPAIRYRPDIDGLRAIAVLAVVINHAAPSLLPGGFLGVDIFFVISGYLISQIIFRELREGSFSFASFYARRIRRLFPALLTVLLAVLAFGAFALFADEYAQLARHAYWSMAFLENFRLMNESGYFDAASHTKPLMHLWSLSVEEQFYLAWPLLMALTWRSGKRKPLETLLLLSLGLLVASWLFTIHMGKQDAGALYFHPFSRVWELLLGATLALLHGKNNLLPTLSLRPALRHALSLAGLAAILAGTYLHRWESSYPGMMTLIPVAGAAVIIASQAAPASTIPIGNRFLAVRPLVWIGLISYPFYLWHWPVLSYLRIMESPPRVLWAGVLVSFLLAALTWRFIEQPIRNMYNASMNMCGTHLKKRRKIALSRLCVSMAVLFLSAYSVAQLDLSSKFMQSTRFSPEIMANLSRKKGQDKDNVCLEMLPEDVRDLFSYCRLKDITGPVIAIIGDSHAGYLFAGFSEIASKHGYSTLLLAENGCLPLDGFTAGKAVKKRDRCTKVIDTTFNILERMPGVMYVVMASRGPLSITGTGFGPAEPRPNWTDAIAATRDGSDQLPEQIFERGMENSFLRLKARGLKTAYLLQVPELGVRPQDCLSSRPLTFSRSLITCSVPISIYRERMHHYRELIARIKARHDDLVIVDPEPLFCDQTECAGYRDGHLYYYDDDHLSEDGAALVASAILDALALSRAQPQLFTVTSGYGSEKPL